MADTEKEKKPHGPIRKWLVRFTKRNYPFIILILLTAFLRFYRIGYPFEVNGIDEGVHLMAGKLGSEGYDMYTQINTLQGPLFLFIYSLFSGNIILCRSLSATFSLAGLLGVILLTRRISNRGAALLAGIFLTFNYYFLKEGRLASLDMFASVFLIWAFFFYLRASEKNKQYTADFILSGVCFSLACMTKLFAVIPLAVLSMYILVRWFHGWKKGMKETVKRFVAMGIFATAIIITVVIVMSIYGLETTFYGIFLNNLSRPSQPFYVKLGQFLLFFGVLMVPFLFSYIPLRRYYQRKEVQILVIWLVPLQIMYLFQSLTWVHHYTIIVPPLCILGSLGVYDFFYGTYYKHPAEVEGEGEGETDAQKDRDRNRDKDVKAKGIGKRWLSSLASYVPETILNNRKKRVVFVLSTIFIVVLIAHSFATVIPVKKPVEYTVAEDIAGITEEEDFIISGDPLITNRADRLQVPEVANLAMVKYPPITEEMLINLTEEYDVKVVVFTYNLSFQEKYVAYIRENFTFFKAYDHEGAFSNVEGEIPVAKETFNIYVRPDDGA